jgi:hypothetical protein
MIRECPNHSDIARLLAAAERGRNVQEQWPPNVINALYESGIINQSEARKALGLTPSARARAAKKAGKVANS